MLNGGLTAIVFEMSQRIRVGGGLSKRWERKWIYLGGWHEPAATEGTTDTCRTPRNARIPPKTNNCRSVLKGESLQSPPSSRQDVDNKMRAGRCSGLPPDCFQTSLLQTYDPCE